MALKRSLPARPLTGTFSSSANEIRNATGTQSPTEMPIGVCSEAYTLAASETATPVPNAAAEVLRAVWALRALGVILGPFIRGALSPHWNPFYSKSWRPQSESPTILQDSFQ